MTKREKYWQDTATALQNGWGVQRKDGSILDPLTLEVLAESTGFLRKNIPDPANMARNGLSPKFRVMDF